MPLSERNGYISGPSTQEMGIGSKTCPWRLEVDTGQYISITLINFQDSADSDGTNVFGYVYDPVKLSIYPM